MRTIYLENLIEISNDLFDKDKKWSDICIKFENIIGETLYDSKQLKNNMGSFARSLLNMAKISKAIGTNKPINDWLTRHDITDIKII